MFMGCCHTAAPRQTCVAKAKDDYLKYKLDKSGRGA